MVKLINKPVYLINGEKLVESIKGNDSAVLEKEVGESVSIEDAKCGTIAHGILQAHNQGDDKKLRIKFDALASHDITYVGIIQTARASGLKEFPVPYVLTNCHNSLCAVGGTINEDDHLFGLSAAKKYGGIYVPAHQAVIHQYMREMMAGCGKMILGSDSHTRYGALGTMAIGEGGPELVKQILSRTYDVNMPDVVCVKLEGKVKKGVGPQDVALAIIGEVFKNGFVKNSVMEFVGDGVKNLTVEFRNGIDVMTTETTCLSSIWVTDEKVKEYLKVHGRVNEYKELKPAKVAYYSRAIVVDLSEIEPMIAMPFHPSNVYKIPDIVNNPASMLKNIEDEIKSNMENKNLNFSLVDKIKNGRFYVEQGIIAGCAGGTYENIVEAGEILKNKSVGDDEFALSVYPSSQPVYYSLVQNGTIASLMNTGANIKTAFCGPCFGAGDVPANNTLSIRHTTRNFPSREGSKPSDNQISCVALMDARSIAATASNGGYLTPATEVAYNNDIPIYSFNAGIYNNRVYKGYKKGISTNSLRLGPNIADWPSMVQLKNKVLVKVASAIFDPVTTTDELIPSGETSSYRSNPLKLAEFALSRKDPEYVSRAKSINEQEMNRRQDKKLSDEFYDVLKSFGASVDEIEIGSCIFAIKPGDGSAREQAASCQRVLGGLCNIANEYATKRYRSNLINWGMLPFKTEGKDFAVGDYILIDNVVTNLDNNNYEFNAKLYRDGKVSDLKLSMDELTANEKEIIKSGCLINFYNK